MAQACLHTAVRCENVKSAVQGARLDLKLDLHARLHVATPAALFTLDAAALQVLFKHLPNLFLRPPNPKP